MLSIAQRLVRGGLHNAEPTTPSSLCFAENDIDLFEGTVGGFGVEEVDDWENEGVAEEV
jgi:hypothetical protein